METYNATAVRAWRKLLAAELMNGSKDDAKSCDVGSRYWAAVAAVGQDEANAYVTYRRARVTYRRAYRRGYRRAHYGGYYAPHYRTAYYRPYGTYGHYRRVTRRVYRRAYRRSYY